MRQVWILNHYAQEPGHPGGTRHFSLASALREHDWNATIIAASVEHNTGRQRLRDGEDFRLESFGDVPFLWLRASKHTGNGAGRIRNMLGYTFRALDRTLTGPLPRPDLVIGSSVHPFAAIAGARLARRHRVPFYFEVRDLWPQTLIDLGRIGERSVTARVMRIIERWLFRRADRIITLLPMIGEYTAPLGVPDEKLLWIPNGIDLTQLPPAEPIPEGDNRPFTFMYFGAHGEANGLDNVLRAVALIEQRDKAAGVKFRLIGDGPLKPGLQSLARELQLSTVTFEDAVPKREIPKLAAQSDAFVFNLVDAPVFKYGISSNKLFDFMAAARPVVFACKAANNPVDDAGAGITVTPGQPEQLADALESVMRIDPAERRRMGEAGRDYVIANHGFDRLAARLAAAMDETCGMGPGGAEEARQGEIR